MTVQQRSVLVVEDEPLIRLALADALEEAGYRVLEAGNVLEAIGVIGCHGPIDALVTDVDMPGTLDGFDLANMVASCHPQAAVIVTSGGRTAEYVGLDPACRFMPKPYRFDEVIAELAVQMSARRRPPVSKAG